jgi:hypothetical protein
VLAVDANALDRRMPTMADAREAAWNTTTSFRNVLVDMTGLATVNCFARHATRAPVRTELTDETTRGMTT